MKAHPFSSRRHIHGFTLVELLTVIAVIGVLAAIFFAVVGKVRESGRKSLCASNLRQNGLAMLQYAADHKGVFPAADSGSSIFSKALIDGGYMPKRLETWTCPTHLANEPETAALVQINDPDRYPRSYAICGSMLPTGSNAYSRGANMNNIANPANTLMLTDLHGYGPGVMRNAVTGLYQGAATFERDRMKAAAAKAKSPWNTSYHADGARNFVFADGHVVFMTAQEANQDKYWVQAN